MNFTLKNMFDLDLITLGLVFLTKVIQSFD